MIPHVLFFSGRQRRYAAAAQTNHTLLEQQYADMHAAHPAQLRLQQGQQAARIQTGYPDQTIRRLGTGKRTTRQLVPRVSALPAVLQVLLILALCCSAILSCASVQTDIRYSGSESTGREQTLADIESALVMQRAAPNTEQLRTIRAQIDALLQAPSTDSQYLARLYALAADTALLLRQPNEARSQLALAARYSGYDEYVQLVAARLISDPEKRLAYLEERITQDPAAYRLKVEAGSLYFAAKDYRNALAAFDAALSFLPDTYQQYYRPQREQSAQLYTIDSASVTESSEKILQANPISLLEMAALTQDSTNALDFITGTAVWRPPLLAKTLQQAGWYHPERDVLTDTASKKDAALFLWRLITGSDEQRLSQYTRYYTNKRRLPIPDVLMDGVYFDAIVGSVEEDVVPLADGKNFAPETPVSGLEFYRWLLKADSLR